MGLDTYSMILVVRIGYLEAPRSDFLVGLLLNEPPLKGSGGVEQGMSKFVGHD